MCCVSVKSSLLSEESDLRRGGVASPAIPDTLCADSPFFVLGQCQIPLAGMHLGGVSVLRQVP